MQNQQTTKGLSKQEIMELARSLGAKSYVVKKTYTYSMPDGYGSGWQLWGYDFFKEPADTPAETLTEVAHSLNHMDVFVQLERPSGKGNVNRNFPKESWEEKKQGRDQMSVSHLMGL